MASLGGTYSIMGVMREITVEEKTVPTFARHEVRGSKRVATRKGASLIVNLGRIPQRVPCLMIDRSREGFWLRGSFRLRLGQVVEVIPSDELRSIRCKRRMGRQTRLEAGRRSGPASPLTNLAEET